MSGPLESTLGFFISGDPLFELEANLDGALSNIAFAGMNSNFKYIRKSKRRLEMYEKFVENNIPSAYKDNKSQFLLALENLRNAYFDFLSGCNNWLEHKNPEIIQRESEDILGENSFLG